MYSSLVGMRKSRSESLLSASKPLNTSSLSDSLNISSNSTAPMAAMIIEKARVVRSSHINSALFTFLIYVQLTQFDWSIS